MGHARRGGHAKAIDTVHWTYGSFESLAQSAGIIAQNVFSAQHLPETLLRMRGEWVGFLDAVQAPSVLVGMAIGLIQVPEGTGATVLWSPITDGDAPWIWYDVSVLGHEEFATDVSDLGLGLVRRVIDSKAMRKLRNTEIQVVIEQATISGASASGINVAGQVRLLAGS